MLKCPFDTNILVELEQMASCIVGGVINIDNLETGQLIINLSLYL